MSRVGSGARERVAEGVQGSRGGRGLAEARPACGRVWYGTARGRGDHPEPICSLLGPGAPFLPGPLCTGVSGTCVLEAFSLGGARRPRC